MSRKTFHDWCIENARHDLLNAWDYEANNKNSITPHSVSAFSSKKVMWKCDKGHQPFPQVIAKRTIRGDDCPLCSKEIKTSFPEQAIFYYVKQFFPDAVNADRHIGEELDIYIPSLKIAIEYDGVRWHKSESKIKKDTLKNMRCAENHITMIRIRENGLPALDRECIVRENNQNEKSLEKSIIVLLNRLGAASPNVDIVRDGTLIRNHYISIVKANSLAAQYPDIAKQWDIELNAGITPDKVRAHSGDKYYWRCERGHSFKDTVSHRTPPNPRGCPYCSGKKVLQGFNDLATVRPDIAKQWDYVNNAGLTPDMFTCGSHKEIIWLCPVCHQSYPSWIKTRCIGEGCPYCANKKITIGVNDLETWCKKQGKEYILNEWDYDKNLAITPQTISHGSDKQVYWKCKQGHSYLASISNRTILNRGCSVCSGRAVAKGINDLATTAPELLKYWDNEKNNVLPSEITKGSNNTKIWWRCPDCNKGWQDSPNHMQRKKSKCSICSVSEMVLGKNDLATTHPQLIGEWDYVKNYPLEPHMLRAGSKDTVFWTCKTCGHSWPAAIEKRTREKTGCPKCYAANRSLYSKKTSVINLDTGEVFERIKDACAKYGVHSANIIKCCKGVYKKTGGFRWAYLEQ